MSSSAPISPVRSIHRQSIFANKHNFSPHSSSLPDAAFKLQDPKPYRLDIGRDVHIPLFEGPSAADEAILEARTELLYREFTAAKRRILRQHSAPSLRGTKIQHDFLLQSVLTGYRRDDHSSMSSRLPYPCDQASKVASTVHIQSCSKPKKVAVEFPVYKKKQKPSTVKRRFLEEVDKARNAYDIDVGPLITKLIVHTSSDKQMSSLTEFQIDSYDAKALLESEKSELKAIFQQSDHDIAPPSSRSPVAAATPACSLSNPERKQQKPMLASSVPSTPALIAPPATAVVASHLSEGLHESCRTVTRDGGLKHPDGTKVRVLKESTYYAALERVDIENEAMFAEYRSRKILLAKGKSESQKAAQQLFSLAEVAAGASIVGNIKNREKSKALFDKKHLSPNMA